MKERKEDMSNLERGFIPLGSPRQYPQNDPNKPEKPPLTSRDSRLHSDEGMWNLGGCCGMMGMDW